MQFAVVLYMAIIGGSVIVLAIESYLYGITLCNCIKKRLHSISCHAHSNASETPIFKQIVEFAQFHSHVKQLSKNTDYKVIKALIHSKI